MSPLMPADVLRDEDAEAGERKRLASALSALRLPSEPGALQGWVGSQSSAGVLAPVAVVRPRSGEEVVATVHWARKYRVPLSTFSSAAGAHERGMTAREATVLMDLSGLHGVLNVEPRDAIAIIEPGVTYAYLDAKLASSGLRTYRPLAPRRNKSVIASMLEREPLLQPHAQWDVLDPFGSAEIVFGSGERFRTGTAAIAGSMAQHIEAGLRYLTAYGPATTDFLRVLQGAQGTLGTVIWAAVMCERVPTVEQSVFVADTDPSRLVQLLAWIHWRRLGNACFLGNALQFASLVERDAVAIDGLARELPPWAVWLRLGHGGSEFPREQLACELEELQAHALSLGLAVGTTMGALSAEKVAVSTMAATDDLYQDRLNGAHRSVFCLQQLDKVPMLVAAVQALLERQGWPCDRLAVYVQPRLQGRNAHVEFVLPCAPTVAGETQVVQPVASALAHTLSGLGGFFSRPYGDWAPLAYARNLALQPYLRQTKVLFDPDRILNPGRLCY